MFDTDAIKAAGLSDWMINLSDPDQSAVFPGPQRVPEDLRGFGRKLAEQVRNHSESEGWECFVVEFAGIRYRTQKTVNGRYELRTLPKKPWAIDDLGFKGHHISPFLSPQHKTKGGLFLVGGATGAGKTTTVTAVINERLKRFGGFLLALEDPPEVPLAGWRGEKSFCEQVEVRRGEYGESLVRALRMFPAGDRSMLFFGEVRDKSAAAQLLNIGLAGHSVFSTVHANGISETIQRIINLASVEIGEREARSQLADSLRICACQRKDNNIPQLTVLEVALNDKVCNKIRNGDLLNLDDEINQQQRDRLLRARTQQQIPQQRV